MPEGKPAGVRCVQLTDDNRCRLFGRPDRPRVCIGLRPSEEMAGGLATTAEALAQATRQAALGLQRLCEGDLRGMFDGPTTPGLDLDAPLVVLDLHAVYDSSALGILMTGNQGEIAGKIGRLSIPAHPVYSGHAAQ